MKLPDNGKIEQGYRQDRSDKLFGALLGRCPENYRLYMIVDAAQDERIYPTLELSSNLTRSLYRNSVDESLKAVGPWLFQLHKGDWLSSWCVNEGLENNWFIIFASKGKTFHHLRHHFRRFAIVQDEQGKHLYFRYYDPRVLTSYLPTCNDAERLFVFGDIPCFWAKETSEEFVQFNSDGTKSRFDAFIIPED